MKKYFLILLLISFLIGSCEHVMSIKQGKNEIQLHLKKNYGDRFFIDSIAKDYNPDLFHEQWGFRLWLRDKNHIRFGPILFEKNKYQGGWITYGGTDVLADYEKEKK